MANIIILGGGIAGICQAYEPREALAKIGFKEYFLRKLRNGQTEPAYEKLLLKLMGVDKLKASAP